MENDAQQPCDFCMDYIHMDQLSRGAFVAILDEVFALRERNEYLEGQLFSRTKEDQMSQCRSCGAPIVWLKTRNGKNMPVDPKEGGEYDEKVVFDAKFHTSHFDTCPSADQHRRNENSDS